MFLLLFECAFGFGGIQNLESKFHSHDIALSEQLDLDRRFGEDVQSGSSSSVRLEAEREGFDRNAAFLAVFGDEYVDIRFGDTSDVTLLQRNVAILEVPKIETGEEVLRVAARLLGHFVSVVDDVGDLGDNCSVGDFDLGGLREDADCASELAEAASGENSDELVEEGIVGVEGGVQREVERLRGSAEEGRNSALDEGGV